MKWVSWVLIFFLSFMGFSWFFFVVKAVHLEISWSGFLFLLLYCLLIFLCIWFASLLLVKWGEMGLLYLDHSFEFLYHIPFLSSFYMHFADGFLTSVFIFLEEIEGDFGENKSYFVIRTSLPFILFPCCCWFYQKLSLSSRLLLFSKLKTWRLVVPAAHAYDLHSLPYN